MKNEFLTLLDAAKYLVTYIDNESVFDRAAAGGCSGMDFHLSDAFYDLIVDARKAINEAENGLKISTMDGNKKILRLLDAAKALTVHVDKEHAFDKVNDMGSVGIETYQSEAFIEVIQKANDAIGEAERGLNVSEWFSLFLLTSPTLNLWTSEPLNGYGLESKGAYMAIEQITYEEYMKKIDELEKRYLSDEKGFPEGAKEKGLEICNKFRREVAQIGPENCEYYIDTLYGLPMHKPIKRDLEHEE